MSTPVNKPVNQPLRRCPICRKPRVEEHTPFCSERCRDRDLGAWLNDSYSLPAEPVDPESIARDETREETGE